MVQEIVDEFGLLYVLSVVAAAILCVLAIVMEWAAFGLPLWLVFGPVAALGAVAAVVKVARG